MYVSPTRSPSLQHELLSMLLRGFLSKLPERDMDGAINVLEVLSAASQLTAVQNLNLDNLLVFVTDKVGEGRREGVCVCV